MSKDYHAKGQKDEAKRKYAPPHDRGMLSTFISPHSKKDISDIKAYRSGWRNARDQKR